MLLFVKKANRIAAGSPKMHSDTQRKIQTVAFPVSSCKSTSCSLPSCSVVSRVDHTQHHETTMEYVHSMMLQLVVRCLCVACAITGTQTDSRWPPSSWVARRCLVSKGPRHPHRSNLATAKRTGGFRRTARASGGTIAVPRLFQ